MAVCEYRSTCTYDFGDWEQTFEMKSYKEQVIWQKK